MKIPINTTPDPDITARPGLFITFEGGEGSGKTTQIKRLQSKLEALGYDVVTTREPGGTPEAEILRSLIVQRDSAKWTPMAEILLLMAARHMHLKTLIEPALQNNSIVICDRFTDSTRAYQAFGHGMNVHDVNALDSIVTGGFDPDLTFILDLDPETGLQRAGKRLSEDESGEDKFENLGLAFHEKLREGFLQIAASAPERCIVLDATDTPEKIGDKVMDLVSKKLPAR